MAQSEFLNPVGQGDYDQWLTFGGGGAPKYLRLADRGDEDADGDGATAPYPGDAKWDTYYVGALLDARSTDRIVRVVAHVRLAWTLAVTTPVLYIRARRNEVDVDSPGLSMPSGTSGATVTWFERSIDLTSLRPEGGSWLLADFGAGPSTTKAQFGLAVTYADGEAFQPTAVWFQVEVAYQPIGVLQPVVRRTASTVAWRGRRAPGRATVVVGPRYGALELGDVVWLSDTLGPSPEGQGWGVGVDDARPVQVREIDEDLGQLSLSASGLVLRQHLVTLVDSGRIVGDVRAADGLLRLDPVVTDIFERGSKAWVDAPDGLVTEVAIDDPACDAHGRLHEGEATNDVQYSAFQTAADDAWTRTGGADYAASAAALFEARVGARVLEVPSGGQASQAAIALPRGTTVVSYDFAGAGALRIQRASDGHYYTPGTASWGAAVATHHVTAADRTRGVVRIVQPDSGTTYTLMLRAAGATAVQWWHVQSEIARRGRGWPSSRIVTLGAVGTRAHSWLATPNDSGARTFPAQDGTWRGRLRTPWTADDVAEASAPAITVWRVSYPGGDEARLRILPAAAPGTPATMEYSRITGATTTAVTLPWTADADVRVACRWQSRAQNGDAPGTLSLWIDGQVARGVGPNSITEGSPSTFARGGASNADGSQLEGWLWDEAVTDVVLSDLELEEVW